MKPTVAIIGASSDRRKFGNKAVRAHVAAGYEVYPVHPSEPTIEGLPVFKSLADVPVDSLDRVTFYLAPPIGLKALDTFGGKKVGTLLLNPGTESPEVVAKANALGLNVATGCSIIDAGFRPDQFPDE